VDDAFTWGQIAAANAASDVYAMGGRPIAALNIAGWPREELPLELLGDVLRGGLDVARRGGFAVVGGHTVDDPEPKYGMVVIGRADPQRIMTIDAALPGEVLVLTKPIGTGVVTTAIKAGAAPDDVIATAVRSMTHLNDAASRVLVDAGVRACTDVTGFGLLGHLGRMLAASGVGAEIDAAAVPLLPGARTLVDAGHVPGGTKRNMDAALPSADFDDADGATRILLCDAQTSGGLLAACEAGVVDRVLAGLGDEPAAAVIGRIVEGPAGRIAVRGRVD
jgi:selenide,water dikinase